MDQVKLSATSSAAGGGISSVSFTICVAMLVCLAASLDGGPGGPIRSILPPASLAVSSVSPGPETTDGPRDGTVDAFFTTNAYGAGPSTFAVSSSMRGKLSGVYSGEGTSAFSFDPEDIAGSTQHFFPGEVVNATLTADIHDGASPMALPYSWRFLAAAGVGPGVYDQKPSVQVGSGKSTDAAMADVDNDGDLDAIIMNNQGANYVHLNNGAGTFSSSGIAVGGSANHYCLAMGDVNEDGFIDIIGGAGLPFTFLNNMAIAHVAGFQAKVVFGYADAIDPANTTASGGGVVIADLNGDGHLDVVCGSASGLNSVILGDGTGLFATAAGPDIVRFGTANEATLSLDVADFNSDGYLDVVTGNGNDFSMAAPDSQDKVYINDGISPLSFSSTVPVGGAVQTTGLRAGDIDHDGDVDVIAAQTTIYAYLNNGGMFNTATAVATDVILVYQPPAPPSGYPSHTANDLALADGDGDGDLDVYAAHANSGDRGRLYVNSGTFSPDFSLVTRRLGGEAGGSGTAVATGDADGDGDLDALVCRTHGNHEDSRKNYLYFNHGTAYNLDSTFSAGAGVEPATLDLTAAAAAPVQLLDFTITDAGTDGVSTVVQSLLLNCEPDFAPDCFDWFLNGPGVVSAAGSTGSSGNRDILTFYPSIGTTLFSVADGASATFAISARLKPVASIDRWAAAVLDSGPLCLKLEATGFGVGSNIPGSRIADGQAEVTNGLGARADIVATHLDFTPSSAGVLSYVSGATPVDVEIAFVDDSGFRDLDADGDILTVARGDGGVVTPSVSFNAVDGIVSFSLASALVFGAPIGTGIPITFTDDGAGSVDLSTSSLNTTVNIYAPVLAVSEVVAGGAAVANGAAPANGRAFGSRDVAGGPSSPLAIFVTNTGNEDMTAGLPSLSSTTHFQLNLTGYSATLQPGQSTSFNVLFDPASAGAVSATVSLVHNGFNTGTPFSFEVGGLGFDTAVNALIEVSDVAAGTAIANGAAAAGGRVFAPRDINTGASAPVTIAISNAGGSALTIGALTLSGDSSDFVLDTTGMLTTIAAGQSASFTVAFDPTAIGPRNATLSLIHDGINTGTPFTFAVAGEGTIVSAGLAVSSVSPNTGPIGGGTLVTLTGDGLLDVTSVSFGGVAVSSILVVDNQTIRVISPSIAAAATVDIALADATGGSLILPGAFAYTTGDPSDDGGETQRVAAAAAAGGCSAANGADAPLAALLLVLMAATAMCGQRRRNVD